MSDGGNAQAVFFLLGIVLAIIGGFQYNPYIFFFGCGLIALMIWGT